MRTVSSTAVLSSKAAASRLLSEEQCEELTSLSYWTRARMTRRGEFPKKIAISPGRKGYVEAEILAWLDERINARVGGRRAVGRR